MKSNSKMLLLVIISSLQVTALAAPKTEPVKCKVAVAGDTSRLDALLAKKIAQRPKSEEVEVDGFQDKFRISQQELIEMGKVSDAQVGKMVELALDAKNPNALSDAAVEQALMSTTSLNDPNVTAFVNDNALLKAKSAARLARQVKDINNKSVQEIAGDNQISPEASAMVSLDQLMKVLQANGGQVGLKVRAGQFLTSLPKVGRFFEGPVDQFVTLADKVMEVIKSLDNAMLQISMNTSTLKDKRDRGDRLLNDLAREVILLKMMAEKLQYAADKIAEVDETASRRLLSQGLARVASLLEGRQALMVGIHVGNQAMQQEIGMNNILIQQVDITKMATVPITAQSLTVRANQELNAQYARRIEGIRAQTQTQLLAMNQGMKEAAVKAMQLANQRTIDPETLQTIQTTVAEVKAYLENGFIEVAKSKMVDIERLQAAFVKGQQTLGRDGRVTIEEAAVGQISFDAGQVLNELNQSVGQPRTANVRK